MWGNEKYLLLIKRIKLVFNIKKIVMKREFLTLALMGVLLFSCQENKKSEEPKEESQEQQVIQTYENPQPYEVTKIKSPGDGPVKNVIFMIGDGMSLMHAYTAWTANRGHLFLESADYIGLSKTYCADNLITDSAASGTAMATGHKTNKGYVGVGPNGESLKTICEYASDKGLSTGVISTCRLVDATPATFSVENIDRDKEEEIAASFVNSGVDFILGGGRKYFNKRKDGKDLLPEFEKNGYQVVTSMEDLKNVTEGKVFAPVEEGDMAKPLERGDELWQGTKKALEVLSKDKDGFFLMVEGSMIDDYGHFNDLPHLMEEIADFDQTVGKVFEWATTHPGTLVVVTADHETGGLTLLGGDLAEGKVEGNFSTKHHSGVMVPVYSFGPGAKEFTGIYENTDLCKKMKTALNL